MFKYNDLVTVQVNNFPHINNVIPISEIDTALLDEIGEVLVKYQATERFGITLLHKHFEMEEDEVLLEHCDETNRTLIASPIKSSELENIQIIETVWVYNGPKPGPKPTPKPKPPVRQCKRFCPVDGWGKHQAYSDHH